MGSPLRHWEDLMKLKGRASAGCWQDPPRLGDRWRGIDGNSWSPQKSLSASQLCHMRTLVIAMWSYWRQLLWADFKLSSAVWIMGPMENFCCWERQPLAFNGARRTFPVSHSPQLDSASSFLSHPPSSQLQLPGSTLLTRGDGDTTH